MKQCPYCGAEVPEGDLYCGECGRKVEAAPPLSTAPPAAKKKFPVLPVAIGVGIVLCLCAAIVGVFVIPGLISQPTPTVVVSLPTHTPVPTRVTPTTIPTKAATSTPIPAPTKPPLSTLTPTPEPASKSLLYEEDFEDPSSGWWTSSDADYEVDYRDGEYVFFIAPDDYSVWTWAGEDFGDFTLDVEAGQVSGPDSNSYGVTFRFQDSDNFYRFSINGLGQYAVHRKADGDWEALVPWTDSPAIHAEAKDILRVVCQGSYMNFYINNVHVANVTDSTFLDGRIGFYVTPADGENNLEVAFDNLQVWEQ